MACRCNRRNPKQLVLLLTGGVKLSQWPEVIVLFRRNSPSLVEVVGDSRGGDEIESRKALVGIIQDRIDDDVQVAQMPTR